MEASDVFQEFNSLAVTEVLDQDSRPTFIVDLDPDERADNNDAILAVFCNTALRLHEKLYDGVTGRSLGNEGEKAVDDYEQFKSWATGMTSHDDSKDVFPLSFVYKNLLWTGSTVRKRWRLISGTMLWTSRGEELGNLSSGTPTDVSSGGIKRKQATGISVGAKSTSVSTASSSLAKGRSSTAYKAVTDRVSLKADGSNLVASSATPDQIEHGKRPTFLSRAAPKYDSSSGTSGSALESIPTIPLTALDHAVIDWTVPDPKGTLTPHLQFARSIKWEDTPLGAMESWTSEFRQVVNLLMSNPHPAALFWGSDLTMIYNEPYVREVAGDKHPALMGTGFSGPFSELWDAVRPTFVECARTGISVRKDDDYLPIERHGLVEETFFSWSFVPLYGTTARILGFYNAPFETTQQVLYQRRTLMLMQLGERAGQAKSVKQFWNAILAALEDNHFDVPFAMLYSVGENEDADQSSVSSGSTISLKSCYLEGSIGIPEGHIAAPKQLDLKRSQEGFVPSFREAMRTREPTLLHTRDGTLPEALLEGIEWRGFEVPCKDAIIFPVRPTNAENVMAFLLIGINPRRPYDEPYKIFTSLLNGQLATSLASLMLYEEEAKRSRDAAEAALLEKERLSQALALQSSRLRRMAEQSPLGMFLINKDGILTEANNRFFEMTGLPRNSPHEVSWMDCLTVDSRSVMEEGWKRVCDDHTRWSGELQIQKDSGELAILEGEPIDYWVLMTGQPEFTHDGALRAIVGSITNISYLKWAQGLQNRRLQEAEETRRKQNEFIDITSHEMRNPLSAILQCADDVAAILEPYTSGTIAPSLEVIRSCIESANTVITCVQHQKSIVDDILTISKLDADLLLITPVPSQPLSVVRTALQIFDPVMSVNDIEISFVEHPSIQEMGIDWVTMDSSSVLKILINLMTNAIKFTAPATVRKITVSIGASTEAPLKTNQPNFTYVPPKVESPNVVDGEDWGTGDVVYLRFKVQDTGCGLTVEEKKTLFERFMQASPRTHAQYGGSGLGLFISRQLAELHGGKVGVASEAGVGSVFGFYIIARKTDVPPDATTRLDAVASPIESQSQQHADAMGRAVVDAHPGLVRRNTSKRQDLAAVRRSSAADVAAGKPVPTPSPIPSPAPSTALSQTGFDPKALDILVVEDNLINQRVLVQQLRKQGSRVAVASDGIECLEYLKTTHFMQNSSQAASHFKQGQPAALSVILMDLEMPNMDGLACVRQIRKLEEEGKIQGHIPVIAVTANVRSEQIIIAKEAGMDDVVSKPFRIVELHGKIKTLLGMNTEQATDVA